MTRSASVVSDLRATLGDTGVLDTPQELERYERGYRYGAGRALAVARPATTEQLSAVVRYCFQNDIRLLAQGANTGLVAASTPDASGEQLVLSLGRLQGVESISPRDRSALVRAGTKLSALNRELLEHQLFCPIDLGADPSIGGMIATNTGGSRLLRYGDVQRNLLGLEVVLADEHATVLRDLNGLRKDNSGIDLKQLFVGTGGSFGIITRAQLELHGLPNQTATALVVPANHAAVPELLSRLEARAGEFIAAFEGMSANAVAAALHHNPRLRNPFDSEVLPEYVVLMELSSTLAPSVVDLNELLTTVLGECLEDSAALIVDARIGRPEELWAIRHSISDGIKAAGAVIAFDISVQRSRLPALRAELLSSIEQHYPFLIPHDFGHCGDGGDHFNLVWPRDAVPAYDPTVVEAVRDLIYDCVVKRYDGSFSAEHGVGPYNLAWYRRYVSAEERDFARRLKSLCDPKGLLGTIDFA